MESKEQLHKDGEGASVDATEYKKVIGYLRYLLHMRLDLAYAVGVVNRYMEKPTVMHHKAVKQILRNVKGTIHYGLVYKKGWCEKELVSYRDSNMTSNLEDRRSTGGMAFYINNSFISWGS